MSAAGRAGPEVNRMDRVYVSDNVTVTAVEHGYADALVARSDRDLYGRDGDRLVRLERGT